VTFFESEEHEIAVMLRHIVLLMTKARRNELVHLGVTPQQIGVMRFMQKFPTPCTIVQLRQVMLHSNSSLVALINRLERKGLVKRETDSQSRKYTRVHITEKGRELYKKAVDLAAFTAIVSSISKEDQKRLKSYLANMSDAAEKTLEMQKS
jgi:DNA-binding MarR family transcriptional regulator